MKFDAGIFDFTLGRVVMRQQIGTMPNMIGHVAGFSLNDLEEVTVVVNWADGRSFPVHPTNLLTK